MNNKSPIDIEALKLDILRRRLMATAVPNRQAGAIPVVDRDQVLPLSSPQQRLWFIDQLDPAGGAAYHMPIALRLQGQLDGAALQQALDRIVARHENLRTRFEKVDGTPRQVIAPADLGFAISHRDLGEMRGAAQDAAVVALATQEARAPFDLTRGPLIRARLLRLAAADQVLLLTMHHIVSDGWTMGVLVREFTTLYAAFAQGQSDPLPPLPIQYADYAFWQRNWLQGPVLQQQLEFWRGHLAGAPALLELPTDRPRPPVQTFAGAVVMVELPLDLVAGLRALSRRHGATLFMTLLASWAVVLSRLSGQKDIVIGTPAANRQRAELAPLTGFFVNTVALRVHLDADPSVADLLAQVKDVALMGYANQETPIEHIFETLQPVRSMAYNTLFQTMLSFNNTPSGGVLELPGLAVSRLETPHDTSRFDLTMSLSEEGEGLGGALEYSTDLFDAATARRWVQLWQRVLAAMVADDSRSVAALPLLDAAERHELLSTFAAPVNAVPRSALIHELFAAQAARTPDAIALEHDGATLTYARLNERANRLAHRLIALGVRADERVAICVERGFEMVVGLLGILKAGGAYVPLDPAYPRERLAYTLADSRPMALLTQAHLRESVLAWGAATVPVVVLDGEEEAAQLAQQPAHDPAPQVAGPTPAHLAYVIYTSGSTGQPKGVMVEHRNVANLVAEHVGNCALTPGDRVLQFSSFSFDASVEEIFPVLAVGATVVLRPAGAMAADRSFARFLLDKRISVVELPTAFWHQWVESAGFDGSLATSAVRVVVIGGEKAEARAFAAWTRGCRDHACLLLNTYGPTEATVYASAIRFDSREAPPVAEIPIGKPIGNVSIYVLDERREPVPRGVTGEMYIGGAQVARGYLERPELTHERFANDPFADVAGARMYRTGDLARWCQDGNLEYLGRNDHQVKIRGFRIELGEIEAQLCGLPEVRAAVVLARDDGRGSKRLVAYVVARDDAAPDAAQLRDRLAAVLPEHMLPSAFVRLDALPLTANGKLDHAALPAPDDASVARREYEAPVGEIEQALALIWQELLGLERVGRQDRFFELGGHSLLAVQVVSRLQQRHGLELPLRELFAQPTLAALARAAAGAGAARQPALVRADRGAALPLSWAQQRLWFLDQLDAAAGGAYHMPTALRLQGALDRAALQAALDRIVARHESLRTRFESDPQAGIAHQAIAPAEAGFVLAYEDLSALAPEAQSARVREQGIAEVQAPFDLARGPLLRGRLLRLAADEHVLLFTMHHIVSDGWSMGVLLREVATLYAAFVRGEVDPLPPLTIQYADYAVWQRDWLRGEVLEQQLAFWQGHLAGAPALLELPTDRPRPPVQSYRGASVEIALPQALAAGVKALGQRHGTTAFMTLLASWSVLLARLSGQADIVVGTPVANRQRIELEALIGFFVNTLALRIPVGADTRVADLLAQVKAATQEAYAHQDVPFEQVVERLSPARSLGHAPLFQVMLTLNNTPGTGELAMPDVALTPLPMPRVTAHFDLSLSVTETADGLVASLAYATDLYDATSAHRLLGQWQHVLAAMVADDAQAVAALPLFGAAERRRLLQDFAAPAAEVPHAALIHELFVAQVARTPAAIAVEYEGEQLTYAQLNAQANRLAHCLMALGVGVDDRVAICVERGVGMVVGLLGILKAGAAYVPLDPTYPRERLAYLLADSRPAVLLTQERLREILAGGPSSTLPVLVLDAAATTASLALQPDSDPDRRAAGQTSADVAYVIYTSGSTGEPKGVMVEHRSVVNLWAGLERQVFAAIPAQGRVGLNAALSFDASVQSLTQLLSGRCVVVVPEAVRRDGAAMRQFVERSALVALDCTPGQLELLLEDADLERQWASVQVLLVGGDVLSARAWQRLAAWNGLACWNVYGPTECTVDATAARIAGDVPNIGRPLTNVPVRILDARGEPVPVGVTGELHIGGVQVARGYLHRPELTAERFVADPFGDDATARMYRTGDLGRWRADGSIHFLGRNDHQVKIRGFRIELGEIEAQLCRMPEVRAAAVLARDDGRGGKRLVAHVVARDGSLPDAAQLRDRLAAVLPEHMLPSAFVRLEALPLTANGKLDRAALPAPDDASMARREFAAPIGEIEQALAQIWQELLGLERVGRQDHFFELGGHSLMAVQVVSRLRRLCGVELPLRELFAQPTLAALARAAAASGAALQPALVRADRGAPLPLSWAQQRLWFLDQLDAAAGSAYHMPSALRLQGELDVPALRRALDRIVARHESLRTRFASDPQTGAAQQVIGPEDAGFALAYEDVSALAADALAAHVRAAGVVQAQAPFDLAAGPLVRAQLLRLAADEHLLLFTMHHIVSDGWSMGVLVREVAALYAAFVRGDADPLPPLPVQYADYAVWQRDWLQGDVLEQQLAFWRGHLAGAPALLELPTDRPRPALQSYRGASIAFAFDATLTAQLKQCAQAHGVTLFMLLHAGWSLLLSRLSGQDDVVVGVPVANRGQAEVEALIGFFVNTVALRLTLAEGMSGAQLLARVKATTQEAFAHQDLPFEQVVEALNPARSLGYGPVFQTLLVLQNTPATAVELPGLRLSSDELETGTAKFDVTLMLQEQGETIAGALNYASDLFDAATMQRWAGHLQVLLGALAADPQQPVAALPLLAAAERDALLAWSAPRATFADADEDATLIHTRFAAQAARTPDAIAVEYEGESLSYAQLDARANQLAQRLRRAGVGPDRLVGLCVERGLELVVGVLAILKAGGAYVPLDPAYPPQRLAYLLDDAAPVLVLVQPACAAVLPASAVPVLVLDEAAFAGESTSAPDVCAQPASSLAYVIYTSGSTGQPKGVMVEHAQVLRLFAATQAEFGFGADDTWTLFHSYAFDFSVWELWGALLYGGRLVVVPALTTRSPAAFYRLLCAQGVTVLNQTPTAFQQLIAAQAELADAAPTHRLQWVVFGGEALSLRALQPWVARNGATSPQLVNMYGITETTVHVTHRRLSAADIAGESASVVGRALADLGIYVLDPRGEPVPVGVTGELYVGGAGVARGYLQRPALTAERFVANPFADTAMPRLYRTGDLGRWRVDGSLEYLGRNDDQVKIRGFRIELGEIEAALRALAGVRDATVLARADAAGEKRLVAYVVAHADTTLELAALRGALAATLAEHLLPSAFVLLAQLPLTTNGKLDRAALPAPDDGSVLRDAYTPPATPAEALLCGVWQDVLGLARVGIDDNYFAAGGDSIRSLQIVRLARERGLALSVAAVFQHQTIRELARHAGAADASLPVAADLERLQTPSLSPWPAELEDAYPLTAMQALMVRESAVASRRAEGVYHVQQYFRFLDPLPSPAAMRAAFAQLARAQPILRTVLVRDRDGELLQGIARDPVLDFAEESVPQGADAQLAWLTARVAADRGDAFAIGGPLFRVRWFATGEDRFDLLFSIHHAIDDGWGNQNFLAELFDLYWRLRHGESVQLPSRVNVFKEYVALEHEAAETASAQAFWASRVARPPAPAFMRRAEPATAAEVVTTVVEASQVAGLQALARGLSVSLKAVLLAATLRLLAGDGDSAAVGVVSNGRSDRLSDPLGGLGLFWNLLPFRLDRLPAATSAGDAALVRAVQAELSAMEAHALYPATRVAELQHGRPPYEATFNFIDFHNAARLQDDSELVLAYQAGHDKFHAPLNYAFSVDRAGGAVVVRVEYDPAYFDAADIARRNHHLLQRLAILATAAAGPMNQPDDARTPLRDANTAVELT